MHITEEPYFYGFDSEAVLHRDAKVAEFGLLSEEALVISIQKTTAPREIRHVLIRSR